MATFSALCTENTQTCNNDYGWLLISKSKKKKVVGGTANLLLAHCWNKFKIKMKHEND